MSIVRNITESTLLLQGPGKLKGIVVNSHTSGTLKIYDGLEAGVVAVGTITQSVGAATPAYHAQNVLTSTGAMVAGSHASATLTVSGAVNFKDAVKGSGVLTSNQSQPTAGQVVVLGNITYTFRALGTAQVSTATACNVNLGNTASLLVVLNAIMRGGNIRFNNSGNLLPSTIHPTNNKTTHNTAIPVIK